jgi:hypothetical protein
MTSVPTHQTLRAQLPGNTYHYLVHTLCRGLPDPSTDSPEELALRNESAIAEVAALCPANLAEAKLAILHVTATEQAMACYRLAEQPEISLLGKLKCLAQANSMARQAHSGLRLLQRIQTMRQKTEANPETCNRAAWTEHCTLNLMSEALQAASPRRSGSGGRSHPRDHPPGPSRNRNASRWPSPKQTSTSPTLREKSPCPERRVTAPRVNPSSPSGKTRATSLQRPR